MVGLTDQEREVLRHLFDAWNSFLQLPAGHPTDVEAFHRSIYVAQNIIGCRVAVRVNPELWNGLDGFAGA